MINHEQLSLFEERQVMYMPRIGIVGGGPVSEVPDLHPYHGEKMIWIGADRGNLTLINQGIIPDYAVGDFDSISEKDMKKISDHVENIDKVPREKDKTDLELAIDRALSLGTDSVYLFGVTGGRLDHEIINIQLLYQLHSSGAEGAVINKGNWLELKTPGKYTIHHDFNYPYISFVPLSLNVRGLTLDGFYYPLTNKTVPFGSSLCISNQLIKKIGTFSFTDGILLLIKSRDV
ncbi:thiamine diphosphokinase [Melghiribacillus thermohalophilus]|uniref:Thiamine diphosphokinase n=1 Tax=Melghiribacillus thermohalophilus TaxID=1324956 RepID=A0A4R3NB42_9BACI|nr:thiamine diphosphokinase [Melghiribacillus thermohalophilus]TCT26817.1 thiamine diphosphokinase [Melghiribacillus thermohalophilus]